MGFLRIAQVQSIQNNYVCFSNIFLVYTKYQASNIRLSNSILFIPFMASIGMQVRSYFLYRQVLLHLYYEVMLCKTVLTLASKKVHCFVISVTQKHNVRSYVHENLEAVLYIRDAGFLANEPVVNPASWFWSALSNCLANISCRR